jgi:hypothetical protein
MNVGKVLLQRNVFLSLARIYYVRVLHESWIPAFAGMTVVGGEHDGGTTKNPGVSAGVFATLWGVFLELEDQ